MLFLRNQFPIAILYEYREDAESFRWLHLTGISAVFTAIALLLAITGCSKSGWFHGAGKNYGFVQRFGMAVPNVPLDGSVPVANPVPLAEQDPEFIWLQIIDTVDDYFRIKSERRFERSSQRWQEGTVETYPEIGATYLEGWRKDSLPGFQRLQSTFQTIRRTCTIKVTPMTTGYSMSVEVIKELEDVDRSASSGEGSSAVRHDGGLVRADAELRGQPLTLGWIRQENDTELEQKILREVLGRVSEVKLPRRKIIPHD